MTVRVQVYVGRARLELQSGVAGAAFALEVFLEQDALARDHRARYCSSPRSNAGASSLHGRQAAWLHEHDGVAARGQVVQRVHVGRRLAARFAEQALRNQRPAAAHVRRQLGMQPAACITSMRRDPDLRGFVLRERVDKQQRRAAVAGTLVCRRAPRR